MTPSSHPPNPPPPPPLPHSAQTHTHSLAAIDSQLSILSTLYPMQPPLQPYYTWCTPPPLYSCRNTCGHNHLAAPCRFTLVLNIVGIISMINKAIDWGRIMFDLLNVTLRKIKTKTKKAKYQKHTISLNTPYPYLQVYYTLKLHP